MIKENKDFIIKLILFVIIFIESIFLVLYIERNKQNTQKIDDLKQENYHLVYENNNLINENERNHSKFYYLEHVGRGHVFLTQQPTFLRKVPFPLRGATQKSKKM